LELLKEVAPKVSRVAVFGTSTQPGVAQALKETELAAAALKVELQNLNVLEPKDIESAFRAANKGRADAVLVLTSPVIFFSASADFRSRGKKSPAGDFPAE
jgi:putative ABC transport system substrate-binding protein